MKLAERGTQRSHRLWVREVRTLSDSGHQTGYTRFAVSMFASWSQENFFKYLKRENCRSRKPRLDV